MADEKRNLPTIQDLYGEVEIRERENDLNVLLNQKPNEKWLKDHPTATREIIDEHGNKKRTPIKYLPIERVEYLLTRIFIKWKVEILFEPKLIGNSVSVTVRLHYKDVLTNEWNWQDGTGAAPLQTDKGAGAIEFDKLKNDAVMKAVPAAESYAVKDAAEKIGKLFGKDLNRADQILYDSLIQTFEPDSKIIKKKIIDALDTYAGADKEKLRAECQTKLNKEPFDLLFAELIAKKIGITL
jgi:hypothetical protein